MLKFDMGDEHLHKTGLYTSLESAELLPFRLLRYGEFISDSHYFTEREGQANCLFLATISGCGVLRYEGAEALLTPGKAAVIDCMHYQYYATCGQEPWHFVWMHFNGTAAGAFVQMMNGSSLRVMEWEIWRAEDFFEQMENFCQKPGRQTDFVVSLWIHQLLSGLAQSSDGRSSARYQQEMLDAAAYIRENLERPLRIADLARRSGLSEYHFLRVFKSIIGQPPYEYLTLLRINRAKQLLAFTNASIAEVAASVGYPETKGLIDNFKRHTGLTPSRFRKQVQQEGVLP
ncbi:MAG: helix-turn-helix domain-containing protein [Candidatus Merdivicinus sp.]